MTPDGEHDQPDDDLPATTPGPPDRRDVGPAIKPDLGWSPLPRSAQPPGERISWEPDTLRAPSRGPVAADDAVPSPGDGARRESAASDRPTGPGDRPATTAPPRRDAPATPAADPSPPERAGERPGGPEQPRREPAPDRPSARPTSPASPPPTSPAPPTPPRSIADPPKPPTPTTLRLKPTEPAEPERPAAPPRDAAPTPGSPTDALGEGLRNRLSALAADPSASPDEGLTERRGVERSGVALGELAQQLAATQSQVAAIGAQLTTLAHRVSYDIERSSQTTSERILRDVERMPETISGRVGADIGPAIDDLTDQIETDRAALAEGIDGIRGAVVPRLASIGEVVDGIPLGHVEVLNALQGMGTDLEDRFTRFASRVGDRLDALERATNAELTRLRGQVDDLRAATARPAASADVLDRMAGQIDRLIERTPTSEDLVDALELLVSEHLDVLRDNLDTRVAALAPAMQQELEAARAESLAGMASAEEILAERIEAIEASLVERMDLALADQADAVDTLLAERHAEVLAAVQAGTAERAEELAELTAGTAHRLDDLVAALDALQASVAEQREAAAPAGADEEALGAVTAELKALRRRISLRLEGGDAPGGLSPEQIGTLAAQIADHLR